MENPLSVPSSTRPELLGATGHLCGFFQSPDEEYRVLLPFITDGFDKGERACHIVEPARRAEHVRRLTEAGIDVADAEASGQLMLLDWSQTYLSGGQFDQKRTLSQFLSVRQAGRASGWPRTRFIAHMEWAANPANLDAVAEYEICCNFSSLDGDVAICAYQLEQWGGRMLTTLLRSHPGVLLGGALHENPFFLPPADALVELKSRHPGASC